ncbi:hypothetical protein [Methylibium sp. Pch-M]|uniref:hypothetical protein n=1 Tax=Methylibium sp. Pch-M TaxID=2082386 RepID=UPI001F5C700B|nr:hypothetical protein [Methylibium sp. Pch-M]
MSYTHLQSFNNRAALARSAIAGCYSCLGSFKPEDVVAWVHDDTTAVCPICSADTVLPGVGDVRALHAARAAQFDSAETVPAVLSLLPERN